MRSIFRHLCDACGLIPARALCRACTIAANTPAMHAAKSRVTYADFQAMLDSGIPARDLVRDGDFTFGIVTLQGRACVTTDDARLRGWLLGTIITPRP